MHVESETIGETVFGQSIMNMYDFCNQRICICNIHTIIILTNVAFKIHHVVNLYHCDYTLSETSFIKVYTQT